MICDKWCHTWWKSIQYHINWITQFIYRKQIQTINYMKCNYHKGNFTHIKITLNCNITVVKLEVQTLSMRTGNVGWFYLNVFYVIVISVWDEFRLGVGLGGGGAEVSCPNIFSHCLHENQVCFTRILPTFLPENCYLKKF